MSTVTELAFLVIASLGVIRTGMKLLPWAEALANAVLPENEG